MTAGARPRLSVVVPCYDEQEVLGELERRVTAVCERVVGQDYELVLVNDGSRDATWALMSEMAHRSPRVVAVDLSRNFGHQRALSAGLAIARGERILIMDADLQDPPELLEQFMSHMDAGADVVIGQRAEREGETRFKVAASSWFYRLLGRMAEIPMPLDAGDFRLVSRRVLDVFLAMPEQFRFVRGMFAWAGFEQVIVPYQRPARHAGVTKYPLRRLIALAVDGITGFSVAPLRLALRLAFSAVLATVALVAFALYRYANDLAIPGWTSTVLILLVFMSVQLVVLGIMAEYLGRTYVNTQGRPIFVVRQVLGAPGASAVGTSGDPSDRR